MKTDIDIDRARAARDYHKVERAIAYLEGHFREQPSLGRIAAEAGLSEWHFQRLFGRWVGISPKRFLQFLTKEYARELLQRSQSVLDAAYETGLSGPGRLHDLLVTCEAVTPGELKRRGEGLTITYGFGPSPFGECLVAATPRGICGLGFVERGRAEALAVLEHDWGRAELREDGAAIGPLVGEVFRRLPGAGGRPLHLFLRGTNFQLKVWEALLRIPPGRVVSYGQIAGRLGAPTASRAVGAAVGANPVAFLIPCHRVIRRMGEVGGYRYGTARKRAMLGWEAGRAPPLEGAAPVTVPGGHGA